MNAPRKYHSPVSLSRYRPVNPIWFPYDCSGVAGERSHRIDVSAVHQLAIAYAAAGREDGEHFNYIAAVFLILLCL